MNHHSTSLSASLWHFQQEGWFCDTTLVARNGVEIPVHAAVLAAASSWLQVELRDSWSACCGSHCRLDMSDCDEATLKAMLKYIYTGDIYALTHCSTAFRSTVHDVCVRIGVAIDSSNLTSQEESSNVNWNDFDETMEGSCEGNESSATKLECVALKAEEFLMDNCASSSASHHERLIQSITNQTKDCDASANEPCTAEYNVPETGLNDATLLKTIVKYRNGVFSLSPSNTTIADERSLARKSLKTTGAAKSKQSNNDPSNRPRKVRRKNKCRRRLKSTKRPTLACHICAQTFSCKKLQLEHVKMHEKLSPKLEEENSNEYELYANMEPKVEQLDFTDCSFTPGQENRSSQEKHFTDSMISSTIERNFVCDVCNRAFIFAAHLRRHKALYDCSDSPHLACTHCDKRFFRPMQLLKHEITHTGVWPAHCETCGVGFLSVAKLAEHGGIAHGAAQPHVCELCGRRFALVENLDRHSRVHDKNTLRRLFKCTTCGKTFRCAAYLRSHELVHAGGARPFVCDVCGKGFLGSSNLTTHRRIHTGERPYACTICNKRFLQLCAVREHEKIHLGLKMFVCHICGKQFMTYAQLYNHSRIHGGVKSFECEVCQKTFYTNGDLVKHARIHGDRRPFVCDVCGKAFKYSSNLHSHARIHTGVRPYVCSTCGKGFTYSSHLSRHAKLHVRDRVSALNEIDTSVGNPNGNPAQDQTTTVFLSSQQPITISHTVFLDSLSLPANVSAGFPILTSFS